MGLLKLNGKLLLIKHKGLTKNNDFWAMPGGGLYPDETLERALEREFKEETNLAINVGKFIGMHEFLSEKLHAIELIFEVSALEISTLKLGQDPETSFQSIDVLEWVKASEAQNLNLHPFLKKFFLDLNENN
jgi:8-oxo-dGTP diphosphatase